MAMRITAVLMGERSATSRFITWRCRFCAEFSPTNRRFASKRSLSSRHRSLKGARNEAVSLGFRRLSRVGRQGRAVHTSDAAYWSRQKECVMQLRPCAEDELDPRIYSFYCTALRAIQTSRVPFLVGGAYALARHTGIVRHTKDVDIFTRPEDCERVLRVLSAAGYRTELTDPRWIAKAYSGEDFIDVIFNSGNGIAEVDDAWFEHAIEAKVFGLPVQLCPAEETIWSKAFIMERERFDGADIAHLLRAYGARLDWNRLLGRFGAHWRVLFSHLVLFGFIYPCERESIPSS